MQKLTIIVDRLARVITIVGLLLSLTGGPGAVAIAQDASPTAHGDALTLMGETPTLAETLTPASTETPLPLESVS